MTSQAGPQAACESNAVLSNDQSGQNLLAGTEQPSVTDSGRNAVRQRLPNERISVTHKFSVGGHEGYITVGLYADQQPGELFITMAKQGSTISGLIGSFAQAVSIALQHGIPLKLFCDKFSHTRFEPSGWTGNPDLGFASSLMDYIFRWLHLRFYGEKPFCATLSDLGPSLNPTTDAPETSLSSCGVPRVDAAQAIDTPFCRHCGALTVRSGSCYVCRNCGASTGCA